MSDRSPKPVRKTSPSASAVKVATQTQPAAPAKRSRDPRQKLTHQAIMQAFEGNIEPVTPTLLYRFCALLVSVVMVLLPLIYIAIIGLVIWGVYFHATYSLGMFEIGSGSGGNSRARGKGMIFLLLLYLAPMVAGVILVVFMFKPLFSRPSRASAHRALQREKEPLLFQFVDQVCDAVGAPRPVQINLDIQVNASAGFRRGWLSMFGNDLVLTIGMPLVAGLSLRQFTGVLAHEFGHFSQGAGMRLSFIIRSINHWFTRVVYERDAWDEKLESLSESLDFRVSWILHLARLSIWFTRKILWTLMMVGHLVSGFLMRQMEFDADRYEARMAGSRCFANTSRRLTLLGVSNQKSLNDLGQFYAEGRLVDNFPALILINFKKLPKEVSEAVEAGMKQEQTGWFDTHPATPERVASAELEETEGLFRLKGPASVLFSDFNREAKFVTHDFYWSVFERKIPREELHSVDELLIRQEAEQEAHLAAERYYQGAIYPNRPLLFSEHELQRPEQAGQCAEELKSLREKVLKYRPGYLKRIEEFREFESRAVSINLASVALRAKVRLDSEDTLIRSLTSVEKANNAQHALQRQQVELKQELEKYESLLVKRLERALQLFLVPKVQAQVPDAGEWERDLRGLVLALQQTNSEVPRLWELQLNSTALQLLMHHFEQKRNDERYCAVVLAEMEQLETLIKSIRGRFKRCEYPFEHTQADISIADFALARKPESNNPGDLLWASESLFDNLMALNHRILGKLCLLAEQVERLLGMEILPDEVPDRQPVSEE